MEVTVTYVLVLKQTNR